MKIETKYDIGDKRFYLYKGKVFETKISVAQITISRNGISGEKYCIDFYEKGFGNHEIWFSSIKDLEKETTATKEEMINKLFE